MKVNHVSMLTVMAVLIWASGTLAWASEMDAKIVQSAKDSYVFKTYLSNDDINVDSKDDVVTLTGTVNDKSHKALAEETVANIPGVKSVDNRLEIKGSNPSENSNEWIALQVKTALLFHRNVSAVNTEVHVEEGIVTLRGEAANEAQKELTGEYANIDGVREVRNEMTIAPMQDNDDQMKNEKGTNDKRRNERVDDASITAQAKMALLTHRATSAIKTSVKTHEGIVTLSGNARNAAEKSLATKIVSDIHGVTNVVNNMAV